MAILITSGFEKNWCTFAQARLANMGIAKSGKSKRSELDSISFLNKMCNSYKLSVDRSRSFRQIDPGKAWQITAADLVVENSDIADWGWADPRNLFFLEFWKEFDSACKFLLVYGSLHQSIAHHIEKKGSFPKSPDAWISRWNSYHSEMLKFYHSNPDRCLLVHISEFSGNANGLARQLQSTLNVPARLLNSEEYLSEDSISILAANQILQSGAFESTTHIGLYKELENAANLPDDKGINTSQIAESALKDHQKIQKNNKLLSQELENQKSRAEDLLKDHERSLENNKRITQKLEDQEKLAEKTLKDYQKSQDNNRWLVRKLEIQDKATDDLMEDLTLVNQTLLEKDIKVDDLVVGLHLVNQTLSRKSIEVDDLQDLIEQKDALMVSLTQEHEQGVIHEQNSNSQEITRLNAKLEKQASQVQDSELTLLQLHQVQEELEYYFSKFQKLQSSKSENAVNENTNDTIRDDAKEEKPNEQKHIIIDFRSFVDGTGWHSPEDIGRWAGITKESAVNLPPLTSGKYLLNVKIIDGMDYKILKSLQLSLNGNALNISRKMMTDLTGPLASIRRLRAEIKQVEKPYPVEIKSVFRVSEKMALNKKHLLSFSVSNVISPVELGEQDTRSLTLCYQLLEIVKL